MEDVAKVFDIGLPKKIVFANIETITMVIADSQITVERF